MPLSPFNLFVAANSAVKDKFLQKRPKTHGLAFPIGLFEFTWDNITKTLHADWHDIHWGFITYDRIDISIFGYKPVPIWKKVHWTGLAYFHGFDHVNDTDGYSIMPEWESNFGVLPPGPWFLPMAVRIHYIIDSNTQYMTRIYLQLVTATN